MNPHFTFARIYFQYCCPSFLPWIHTLYGTPIVFTGDFQKKDNRHIGFVRILHPIDWLQLVSSPFPRTELLASLRTSGEIMQGKVPNIRPVWHQCLFTVTKNTLSAFCGRIIVGLFSLQYGVKTQCPAESLGSVCVRVHRAHARQHRCVLVESTTH